MKLPTDTAPVLRVRNLKAWYGESHVLHDIDLDIGEGEIVALLGRNGVGKSTTLKSLIGLMERKTGTIEFKGQQIADLPPERIARLGMAYCPEDRGIFAKLSVRENLLLPPKLAVGGLELAEIFQLFPNLHDRLDSPGTKLSGGEQQMLAIARILRAGAKCLLLDEPTEGLAPVIVHRIASALRELKRLRYTIIIVEQSLHFAQSIADRFYVMDEGRVRYAMSGQEFEHNKANVARVLGV